MFIWTEDPIGEIWRQLKLISYTENCKSLLIGKIKSGRNLLYDRNNTSLARKTTEISMCIQQGLEYFEAANRVTINTSPLLIYYGMLSLAKALIVANVEGMFIDDIKYHGLSTRPINAELERFRDNKSDWSIENEFAIIKGGIFNEFNKILNPNRVIPHESIVRLKECFSSVPEMKTYYEKYYQEPANSFRIYSELGNSQLEKGKIEFSVDSREDINVFLQLIPKVVDDFTRLDDLHKIAPYFRSKGNIKVEDVGYFDNYHSCVGGRYFVNGLKYELNGQSQKLLINQALIDYICMFILGEQVRYHQDFWRRLVQGEDSGTLGLIEVYINIVKRRYPNLILNYLFGEEFGYGVPARLS